MFVMNKYSAWGDARCDECSKKEVCKYTDDVQSYISLHRAPLEIDCLNVDYKCKYFDIYIPSTKTFTTNILDGEITPCSEADLSSVTRSLITKRNN